MPVRAVTVPSTLLVLCTLAGSSHAVVPSARAVVEHARKATPDHGTLLVNLVHEPAEGPPLVAMRLVLKKGAGAREEVQNLVDGTTAVRVWTRADRDPESPTSWTSAPAWIRLLAGDSVADVARDHALDMKRTSLSRAGYDICWVIGAGPADPGKPRIEVERTTGRLRRTVERSTGAAPKVRAVHLDEWPELDSAGAKGAKEGDEAEMPVFWPRRITLVDDGVARVLRVTVILADQPVAPEEFVVDAGGTGAVPTLPSSPTAAPATR